MRTIYAEASLNDNVAIVKPADWMVLPAAGNGDEQGEEGDGYELYEGVISRDGETRKGGAVNF